MAASISDCSARYGIGPTTSITGGPNCLSGATSGPPSAGSPGCAAAIPHAFWPSGPVMSTAAATSSSGAVRRKSPTNVSASFARAKGWTTSPPVIRGPTACNRYSKAVTTPKFPPPPRMAQNRSAWSSLVARTRRPSARTTSAAMTLSTVMPNLPSSHPKPPPSVNPAMPVSPIVPRWSRGRRPASRGRTPSSADRVRRARFSRRDPRESLSCPRNR